MLQFSWLANNRDLALTQHLAPSAPGFTVVQPFELEDATHFIQPGSLVLTVGIAFRDRPGDLGLFINDLADAGATAVGFGTSARFEQVPQVVIDTAKLRGIGLYEVPHHVPFISIISASHQEQRRISHIEQQKLVTAQEKLTAAATSGSLDALLQRCADILEARVTVRGGGGSLVASAKPQHLDVEDSLHYTSYKMATRAGRHHVLEVFSKERVKDPQRALIRHCTGLADMILARPAELRAARNELNSFALALHLGLGEQDTLLPNQFDSPTDDSGLTRPVVVLAERRRELQRALNTLDHTEEKAGRFLFSVPLSQRAALILMRADRPVQEIIEGFGRAARRIRIAVGAPVEKPEKSYVSALESRARLLALGEHSLPEATQQSWLTEPAVATALKARNKELLGPLEREDHASGTDLARTLTVFLRNGGHLAQTAEALEVHRHTVRHRIARIEEVCRIDLSNPATFSEAFFASIVGA